MWQFLFHAISFIALVIASPMVAGSATGSETSSHIVSAVQVVARLTGTLKVDIRTGSINADFCLEDIPEGIKSVALNRGMNIREFRRKTTRELMDYEIDPSTDPTGDSTRYLLAGEVPLDGICTSYSGMFPVYDVSKGERATNDWKGKIAFNGTTVRAADQSRFYPVPVLPNGNEQGQLRYAVTISCRGCQTIYWSGSPPAKGPTATFTSNKARDLMLYAGRFSATSKAGAHFIGAPITDADAEAISAGVQKIARIHEDYLGIEYADRPSFLSFASADRNRKQTETSWQFVVWPTIAADGLLPFSAYINKSASPTRLNVGIERLLSHEMAHYYFGTLYAPSGPLRWFLLESTAEFMSLNAIRSLQGETQYNAAISARARDVASRTDYVPLNQVNQEDQIDELYRYKLGPLLLVALERRTSRETVQQLLSALASNSVSGLVDYRAIKAWMLRNGVTPAALADFELQCLLPAVTDACWK